MSAPEPNGQTEGDARLAPVSGSGAQPRMTPAVAWVIARALKRAADRQDEYVRLEDIQQAMVDQVNNYYLQHQVPPNIILDRKA